MNYDEIKEENLLDEALNNAANLNAPDENTKQLLMAGKKFAQAIETQAANDGLNKLLQKLPNNKQNSFFNSVINYMTMPKIFALRPMGTIVAIVLFAVGGIQIIQNATAPQSNISGGVIGTASNLLSVSRDESLYGRAGGYESPVNQVASEGLDLPKPDTSSKQMAIAPGMPYPTRPDYYNSGDIRDTREYLKTSYYASLKSRHPNILAERAQITIRGFGGRVDNASISETNSYVSFALPKDKFEQFRTEIKTFVNARFITENISSQNLLPDKQNIELNTNSAQTALDKQLIAKKELDAEHAVNLKNLNAENARLNKLIVALQNEAKTTTDEGRLAEINKEISDHQKSIATNRRAVTAENSRYKNELASLNNQIEYYKNQLTDLAKQDVGLSANVETVQGSVSFSKITLFQVANTYLSGYLPAVIWIAIGLAVFFIVRRQTSTLASVPIQ